MKNRSLSFAILGASLLAAPGCLELIGPEAAPECAETLDCNYGSGEVCDEGLCWGDPPADVQLAVVVGPPPERLDLVTTELTTLGIDPDGWMSDLSLSPAIALHGRIELACEGCPESSLAATVQVRRASRILGGPDYLATVSSMSGIPDSDDRFIEDDSFSLLVPAVGPQDPQYEITIIPSDTAPLLPGGLTPAGLVPPVRRMVTLDELANGIDQVLDTGALRVVNGRVVDALGEGLEGMRVRAVGRFDALDPVERVSTIATTDGKGFFVLLISADALDVVDVIAAPPMPGTPTLIARDQFVAGEDLGVMRMPSFPAPVRVTIPVVSHDPAGNQLPVADAHVQLATIIEGAAPDPRVQAVFTVETSTGPSGNIEVDLIPGTTARARDYVARIIPSPNDSAATAIRDLDVGAQGGVLERVDLDPRSAVTGIVVDHGGVPVEGLTVTAHPSLSFVWSLDAGVQDLLADVEPSTVATDAGGSFLLWVDPAVAASTEMYAASYDLECEPAEQALVPRWTVPGVATDPAAPSIDVGVIFLPDAALVRARVVDPDGEPVAGALVRVYQVAPDLGACASSNAPSECEPPATLQASGRSDADGVVRLVLPRPF